MTMATVKLTGRTICARCGDTCDGPDGYASAENPDAVCCCWDCAQELWAADNVPDEDEEPERWDGLS